MSKTEQIAKSFHEAYERLAPLFGYKTRRETAVDWEKLPVANRKLMMAVVSEIMQGDGVKLSDAAYTAMLDREKRLIEALGEARRVILGFIIAARKQSVVPIDDAETFIRSVHSQADKVDGKHNYPPNLPRIPVPVDEDGETL